MGAPRDRLWLRSLAEESGVGLVFSGDLALLTGIGLFPQLKSRMRRPIIIHHPTLEDVAVLARAFGVTDPTLLRVLFGIAKQGGALRNVRNVLDSAWIFEGGTPPQAQHIKEAIMDERLDRIGGAE